MSQLLIVDDEPSIAWSLSEFLRDQGHEVAIASSAEEGLGHLESNPADAILLDVRLPGMDGIKALPLFRDRAASAPIIVMTAFGDLETAVSAIEGGAFDYLIKPFDLHQANVVVRSALSRLETPGPSERASEVTAAHLIGRSNEMQEVYKQIALVARAEVPVLITGETGTGKELVARAIHAHSHRAGGPFVPISLAALAPGLVEAELFGQGPGVVAGAAGERAGLLELAAGGTILLDEIGDVPGGMQQKLLRALEQREISRVGEARTRPIDVRVIAATNRSLEPLLGGAFREDLYYRLSVFSIDLPPLRERRGDLRLLAAHFLERAGLVGAGSPMFTDEFLAELVQREWPGNVRELRNAIEHAALRARGGPISRDHLPPPVQRAGDAASGLATPNQRLRTAALDWLDQALADEESMPPGTLHETFLEVVERPFLRKVVDRHGGNLTAAAALLGMHRATLRQKLKGPLEDG